MPVPLFGHPAPIAAGPALLALETGAPVYAASARRARRRPLSPRALVLVPAPTEGIAARAARRATPRRSPRAFEAIVADAPEQWWGAFHPIWPDLVVAATAGRRRRAA